MTQNRLVSRQRERGQTIFIAMAVLGVLLILGIVFIGIVGRGIRNASAGQNRTVANDLAEAGVRYAHSQLLYSLLGADWRPEPSQIVESVVDFTRDPDIYYLRPGTGYPLRADTDPQIDLGGPDGLGPFTRVNYQNGRALIRVRYAPSDANIFNISATGALRRPGLARNYLHIEAIGRQGRVDLNDPTTLGNTQGQQYRGFANSAAFRTALGQMSDANTQFPYSRKLDAFVSIGTIETARFITDKHRQSRPAEIGIPDNLGARFNTIDVGDTLSYVLGASANMFNVGPTPTPAGQVEGLGSFFSNADITLHGDTVVFLNRYLGDQFDVAGSITGTDDATLTVFIRDIDRFTGTWNPITSATLTRLGNPSFSSRSNYFNTLQGLVRDGVVTADPTGYSRGLGRKEPPSLLIVDPETGENRYVVMTRESGRLINGVNVGRFGYGQGVYVDNFSDRQTPKDEGSRSVTGTSQSLIYDWLNPNNGQERSGWVGPYYIPYGSYVQLMPDGFMIMRDGRAPPDERQWKLANGGNSGASVMRYRIGREPESPGGRGRMMIVNTFTPGIANINGTLTSNDYARGEPFNGVLYFEGNVRVRGVIPTDVQLSLVSNGTIYIEGSITRGVTGTQWTATYNSSVRFTDPAPTSAGQRLSRPSRSTLWLAARDYVALNTPNFFGPSPFASLEEVNEGSQASLYTPVRMQSQGGSLPLISEFVLNPDATGSNPNNPATWPTFVESYTEMGTSNLLNSSLYLVHTMDDFPEVPTTFISLDVNYGFGASTYNFPAIPSNTASNYLPGARIPVYGLGGEPWQIFERFEGIPLSLINPATLTSTPDFLTSTGPEGSYVLFTQSTNELLIRPASLGSQATNDYLLARSAVIPHDIRIEAAIFAEEGSFFVIPGQWFNANPNDRRDTYAGLGASAAERENARLENYGNFPHVPFYGEPPDIRVTIIGAVAENMPPPMSQQSEWIKKWGWTPRELGASGVAIPNQHIPPGDTGALPFVPNLIIRYDPVLATARTSGFVNDNNPATLVRVDEYGRALPPIPRLPVSPALAYFGEVE